MISTLMGDNVAALTAYRESLHGESLETARLYDAAHALYLRGRAGSPEFADAFGALRSRSPEYAPGRFLAREVEEREASQPVLQGEAAVGVIRGPGPPARVVLSVVTLRIGPERGFVAIVDNAVRETYGESYVDAPGGGIEGRLHALAQGVLAGIRSERLARTAPEWRSLIEALLGKAADEPGR